MPDRILDERLEALKGNLERIRDGKDWMVDLKGLLSNQDSLEAWDVFIERQKFRVAIIWLPVVRIQSFQRSINLLRKRCRRKNVAQQAVRIQCYQPHDFLEFFGRVSVSRVPGPGGFFLSEPGSRHE